MTLSRTDRAYLALVSALGAQTIAALLWAGAAAERLTQLEQRITNATDLSERTARLEEQGIHIRDSLLRIERKIDDSVIGQN